MKTVISLALGTTLVAVCAAGTVVWLQQRRKEEKLNLQEQCKEELKLYGDKFEGLYSATARLRQKGHSMREAEDLCFRWESRLKNDERTAGLKMAWTQLDTYDVRTHIERWYDLLIAAGVNKCEEKEVVVDRMALQKYDLPDEAGSYAGKKMYVEVPCWMLEEKVLEKGTLA